MDLGPCQILQDKTLLQKQPIKLSTIHQSSENLMKEL